MVLPAIGAALSWGYGALPAAIGSILPGVIDAIAGAKTEEEARRLVGPQREAMVARLIGGGTPRAAAEAQADEAIQGEVQKKMQEGALPGWATAALGIAGAIGGGLAGVKAGKLLKGTATKQAESGAAAITKTPEAPAADVKGLPFGGGTYRGKAAQDIPETAPDEIVPPFGRRAPSPEPTDYMRNPAREVQPMGVRDTEAMGLPAPQVREPDSLLLPFTPRSMPMDVHEERLIELAQHARRTPKAPPRAGVMSDLALPFNEAQYVDDLMRANPQGF